MKLNMTKNNDLIDNVVTMEQFGEMLSQRFMESIHRNPTEFVNQLLKDNVITEEEYKEMIINIRKTKLEEDFSE